MKIIINGSIHYDNQEEITLKYNNNNLYINLDSNKGIWCYYSTCNNYQFKYKKDSIEDKLFIPILSIDSTGYFNIKGEKSGWWYYFEKNVFQKAQHYKKDKLIHELVSLNDTKYSIKQLKRYNSKGFPLFTLNDFQGLIDTLYYNERFMFQYLCKESYTEPRIKFK